MPKFLSRDQLRLLKNGDKIKVSICTHNRWDSDYVSAVENSICTFRRFSAYSEIVFHIPVNKKFGYWSGNESLHSFSEIKIYLYDENLKCRKINAQIFIPRSN
jgi:hypothetical protein